MSRIRVHNLHGQVHPVEVKISNGKTDTRFISPRGFIEVDSSEFTQDLYDKNRRGIVRFAPVDVPVAPDKGAPAPLPTSPPASPKVVVKEAVK